MQREGEGEDDDAAAQDVGQNTQQPPENDEATAVEDKISPSALFLMSKDPHSWCHRHSITVIDPDSPVIPHWAFAELEQIPNHPVHCHSQVWQFGPKLWVLPKLGTLWAPPPCCFLVPDWRRPAFGLQFGEKKKRKVDR
ncbi:hypothetical protein Pelo_18356 [Pelomyxa schiedti]|nr:hypothetical protein Pelo_18356 [Pelomyxa schiedti]